MTLRYSTVLCAASLVFSIIGAMGQLFANAAPNAAPYANYVNRPQYGGGGDLAAALANTVSGQYGSGGGCCMPAATANALASAGIGAIYYDGASDFATDANPTVVGASRPSSPPPSTQPQSQASLGQNTVASEAQLIPQYGLGGKFPYNAPNVIPYGSMAASPVQSSLPAYGTNWNANGPSNTNYGSASAHYCFPVCGGQFSTGYGGSVYSSPYGSYSGSGFSAPTVGNFGNTFAYGSQFGGAANGGRIAAPITNIAPFDGSAGNEILSTPLGIPRRASPTSNAAAKRAAVASGDEFIKITKAK